MDNNKELPGRESVAPAVALEVLTGVDAPLLGAVCDFGAGEAGTDEIGLCAALASGWWYVVGLGTREPPGVLEGVTDALLEKRRAGGTH